MRNPVSAAFVSICLLSAVVGTQFISLATANPLGIEERFDSPPILSIDSPVNGSDVNSVLLNVTVVKTADWLSTPISFSYEPDSGLSQRIVSVSFHIDGKSYGSVTPNSNLSSPFTYSLHLTNLTDGIHTLIVRVDSTGVVRNYVTSTVYNVPVASVIATAYFTLDSTPPNVSFPSKAKAYATAEVPLNFTVNESVSKISYVLDGQENVTVAGNTTLTGLSAGEHTITIYSWDVAGNVGASETVTFTVESFPVVPVAAASVASVAVVGVGLMVYFKKRKH